MYCKPRLKHARSSLAYLKGRRFAKFGSQRTAACIKHLSSLLVCLFHAHLPAAFTKKSNYF